MNMQQLTIIMHYKFSMTIHEDKIFYRKLFSHGFSNNKISPMLVTVATASVSYIATYVAI